jgi:hypothetical protein
MINLEATNNVRVKHQFGFFFIVLTNKGFRLRRLSISGDRNTAGNHVLEELRETSTKKNNKKKYFIPPPPPPPIAQDIVTLDMDPTFVDQGNLGDNFQEFSGVYYVGNANQQKKYSQDEKFKQIFFFV